MPLNPWHTAAALLAALRPGVSMNRIKSLSAITVLMFTALAHAPSMADTNATYTVGQKLSKRQVHALGPLPAVEINNRNTPILATGSTENGVSYSIVLGPNGMVGHTAHELVIPDTATETVRARFAPMLAPAVSVDYQDGVNLTIARFETLTQAALALQAILNAQPESGASIPITYESLRTR